MRNKWLSIKGITQTQPRSQDQKCFAIIGTPRITQLKDILIHTSLLEVHPRQRGEIASFIQMGNITEHTNLGCWEKKTLFQMTPLFYIVTFLLRCRCQTELVTWHTRTWHITTPPAFTVSSENMKVQKAFKLENTLIYHHLQSLRGFKPAELHKTS